jgi:uncharacterized protein with GYD domain
MKWRGIITSAAIGAFGLGIQPLQAQQGTVHRYLVQASFTSEGIKNFQKQPPTALRAGVIKFAEAVGGKVEAWYFDYADSTAFAIVTYPSESAAATAMLSTNATGLVRVRLRPLITAEEADSALAKTPGARPPQQQQ